MFGVVINENNIKVAFVILNDDKTPQFYTLKDGETIVETDWDIANTMLKPKWNGSMWTESATEEEIQAWKEENIMVQEEPSESEVLMSNIILENATLKRQIAEQQELTSTLMLQIAELKGGNTNV